MYLEQLQSSTQQQTLNISAKLIASIKILQCSAEELEQTIAAELSENPALEVEELASCTRCGSSLRAGICPNCDRRVEEPATDARQDAATWEDDFTLRGLDLSAAEDGDYDPLDFVTSGATLNEYLLRQLGSILPNEDLEIAEYLVGNLNSHGYVTVTLVEAGIGARDLRECLLIQLEAFEERGQAHPVARRLLSEHLHELGEHHFVEIAREIGATSAQVKAAWRFIRANLHPFPAHAFESGDVPDIGLTLG